MMMICDTTIDPTCEDIGKSSITSQRMKVETLGECRRHDPVHIRKHTHTHTRITHTGAEKEKEKKFYLHTQNRLSISFSLIREKRKNSNLRNVSSLIEPRFTERLSRKGNARQRNASPVLSNFLFAKSDITINKLCFV